MASPYEDIDVKSILGELDIFKSMMILADRLKELGATDEAAAWEIIAKNEKFPVKKRKLYYFVQVNRPWISPHFVPVGLKVKSARSVPQAFVNLATAICEVEHHFRDSVLGKFNQSTTARPVVSDPLYNEYLPGSFQSHVL